MGTVRGEVTSSWSHDPGVITLHVDVPVGSTATVAIPEESQMTEITVHEGDRTVWEKGQFVEGTPGVTSGAITGDPKIKSGSFKDKRVIFEVGSGHYDFRLEGN